MSEITNHKNHVHCESKKTNDIFCSILMIFFYYGSDFVWWFRSILFKSLLISDLKGRHWPRQEMRHYQFTEVDGLQT